MSPSFSAPGSADRLNPDLLDRWSAVIDTEFDRVDERGAPAMTTPQDGIDHAKGRRVALVPPPARRRPLPGIRGLRVTAFPLSDRSDENGDSR